MKREKEKEKREKEEVIKKGGCFHTVFRIQCSVTSAPLSLQTLRVFRYPPSVCHHMRLLKKKRPHTELTEEHGAHGGRYKFSYIFIRFTREFGDVKNQAQRQAVSFD